MTIFEEARVRFNFWKMIIFNSFLISFSSSFLKNGRKMKTENEPKMARKWLLWTTLMLYSGMGYFIRIQLQLEVPDMTNTAISLCGSVIWHSYQLILFPSWMRLIRGERLVLAYLPGNTAVRRLPHPEWSGSTCQVGQQKDRRGAWQDGSRHLCYKENTLPCLPGNNRVSHLWHPRI